MKDLISLYRDAVRDDWDKQTDATLANMQEAEQNILSHLAAGEAAVKKVAELENEVERLKKRELDYYKFSQKQGVIIDRLKADKLELVEALEEAKDRLMDFNIT